LVPIEFHAEFGAVALPEVPQLGRMRVLEMEIWPDKLIVSPSLTISGSQAVHRPLGIAIGDHPPLGGMFSIRTPARTEYTSYGSSEERVLRIGVPDAAAAGST
jgi:hypothetical protein